MSEPVVIERWADTPFGVFGTLTYRGFSCFTLEDDWLQNAKGKSCIPAGSYTLRKVMHHGVLPTYQIYPVPEREHINIHTGNTESDTEGCVLLGLSLHALEVPDEDDPLHHKKMTWAVRDSKKAHTAFVVALAGQNDIPIAIRWRVW